MLENCNPNSTQKLKRLLIKLGSKCNLQCKYCHQRKVNYKFNDDILKFLQNCNDLECITFSGGEPLLFKSEIQKIIDTVKDKNVQFKIVTNGTLFNNDTIDWINRNNIVIGMSFDGFKNLRGMTADFTALDEIKNFSGVSTVVTNKFNWDDFVNDIAQLVNDTGRNLLAIPNFVHQTKEAPNFDLVDQTTIDKYIDFVSYELELEYDYLKNHNIPLESLPYLYRYVTQFIRSDLADVRGVKCCNEQYIAMNTEGDFLLCGYGEEKVGNIYSGIDFDKVESFIPDRCKHCGLWRQCRNTCITNITENECYIYKQLYSKFKQLEFRYGKIEVGNGTK